MSCYVFFFAYRPALVFIIRGDISREAQDAERGVGGGGALGQDRHGELCYWDKALG